MKLKPNSVSFREFSHSEYSESISYFGALSSGSEFQVAVHVDNESAYLTINIYPDGEHGPVETIRITLNEAKLLLGMCKKPEQSQMLESLSGGEDLHFFGPYEPHNFETPIQSAKEKAASTEIERKFLIDPEFVAHLDSYPSDRIWQGYTSIDPTCTVRFREKSGVFFITIKGLSNEEGTERPEIEKQISAEIFSLLKPHCKDTEIDKVRHYVVFFGNTFEVDAFLALNAGLYLAELEFTSKDQTFQKPAWLGEEVTGRKEYYNSALTKFPFTQWNKKPA